MGKRLSMLPLIVVIVIVAVFAGSQSFYVLENAEQAVIERFGQLGRCRGHIGPKF